MLGDFDKAVGFICFTGQWPRLAITEPLQSVEPWLKTTGC